MERLELHKAVKAFGTKQILRNVHLSMHRGQILGLFGRNGSGKSTLLRALFGTLKIDEIEVSIDGKTRSPQDIIPNQYIGYCPQHGFLPNGLKVRDAIPLFHTSESVQDAIFYDSHIATMTAKQIGTLSLGERKYFEVLLLAHLPHPFLMLDEPFSMLEPIHKEKLKQFLSTLKLKKGILITDHYYQDVLAISDCSVVLHQGNTYPITTENDLQRFEYLTNSNYTEPSENN